MTELLAFPGAIGYGRYCQGGRGGRVYHITTLEDYAQGETPIPGSMREAILAKEPRILVFDVAGTIELKRQMTIYDPYITIAGHTAPGQGICLRSGPDNLDGALSPRARQVIICGLTVAPGPGGTSLTGPRTGDAVDAIGNVAADSDAGDLYIRDCTCLWSVDELVEVCIPNVTVAGCLLAEPLNLSTHSYTAADPRIGHAKAILANSAKAGNVMLYRVVTAHTMDRQPAEISLAFGTADLVNCGCYNWGTDVAADGGRQWIQHCSNQFGDFGLNVIGCWFKPGPDSVLRKHLWYGNPDQPAGSQLTVYLAGNLDFAQGAIETFYLDDSAGTLTYATAPLGLAAYGTPLSAIEAYDVTVNQGQVGAWYRLNDMGTRVARNNPYNERVLRDIHEGGGKIIDSEQEVGGWPYLEPGTPLDWNENDVPKAFAEQHPGADIEAFLWG